MNDERYSDQVLYSNQRRRPGLKSTGVLVMSRYFVSAKVCWVTLLYGSRSYIVQARGHFSAWNLHTLVVMDHSKCYIIIWKFTKSTISTMLHAKDGGLCLSAALLNMSSLFLWAIHCRAPCHYNLWLLGLGSGQALDRYDDVAAVASFVVIIVSPVHCMHLLMNSFFLEFIVRFFWMLIEQRTSFPVGYILLYRHEFLEL
jgi:hypothetical protein